MSQWTFCHTYCLFWISKHCNCLGYGANATCSSVSHNIWIHHLTNCGSVTIKSGSGEPAETPERGLSGQEEEAAWLSMPEIIISIIFCNFQHLNRAKPSQETKQRPARLRLPPEKAHSEACESLPAEREPSKNSLCSWWRQQEACFQRSRPQSPFTPAKCMESDTR